MSGRARKQTTPQPGSVVAGRYLVERELGIGGMATVLAVVDKETGIELALKILRKEISGNTQALARHQREADVLMALQHPSIVAIHSTGQLEDGQLFIAMERLVGETLGDRIRAMRLFTPVELTPILTAATAGLERAHASGIIHRDLKPDNIFLSRATPSDAGVKLLDFGISKVYGVSEKLTRTGEVLGTPRYMAPEQLNGEADIDRRVDVYSLGVILYEALVGHPPFKSSHPSALLVAILRGEFVPLRSARPEISPEVAAVVERAMSRSREARYATVKELCEAWMDAADGQALAKSKGRTGNETAPLGTVTPEMVHSSSAYPRSRKRSQDASGDPEADAPVATFRDLAATPAIAIGEAAAQSAAVVPSALAPRPGAESVLPPTKAHNQVDRKQIEAAFGSQGATSILEDSSPSTYDLPLVGAKKPLWPWLLAGAVGALVAAILIAVWSMTTSVLPEGETPKPKATETPKPKATKDPTPPASSTSGSSAGKAAGGIGSVTPPADASPTTNAVPAPLPTIAAPVERGLAVPDDAARTTPNERSRTRATKTPPAPSPNTSPAVTTTETSPSAATSPNDVIRQARRDLGQGRPTECIDKLTALISIGAPPTALRFLGDCQMRAGQSDLALQTYEKFCRVAQDHPAISEVRAILESHGRQCN